MKSMNKVTKVLKGSLAAVVLAAAVSAVPSHAGLVAGGTIPVINQWRGIGVTGLDFSVDGAAVTIASIWIDNNTPNGWDLTVTPTNFGFGLTGSGSADIAFDACDVIEATTQPATSNLGTGAVWADIDVSAASGNTAVGAQTDATVDYQVDIVADWTGDATLLAGFYSETFTISLQALL